MSGTLEYVNAPAPARPHPGVGVITFNVDPLVVLDECGMALATCEPVMPPAFLAVHVRRGWSLVRWDAVLLVREGPAQLHESDPVASPTSRTRMPD